jgi:ATP-binding cassette subfamily C (CFTR/MRP) protein 1
VLILPQIGTFAGLGIAQASLMFSFAFGLTLAGTTASRILMQQALKSALRAPMFAIPYPV